jgi:hypothetical protein
MPIAHQKIPNIQGRSCRTVPRVLRDTRLAREVLLPSWLATPGDRACELSREPVWEDRDIGRGRNAGLLWAEALGYASIAWAISAAMVTVGRCLLSHI